MAGARDKRGDTDLIEYSEASSRIVELAPAGHYIAIRMGFAAPLIEVNALPTEWVQLYIERGYFPDDPTLRWIYSNDGVARWSELFAGDSRGILSSAQSFGLNYGAVVSYRADVALHERSFATFHRSDREFLDEEVADLQDIVTGLHAAKKPPGGLTKCEIDVLKAIKSGLRLKQIAYDFGVTEGAIKQRLKNARGKLGAATGTQAAALASEFGLI